MNWKYGCTVQDCLTKVENERSMQYHNTWVLLYLGKFASSTIYIYYTSPWRAIPLSNSLIRIMNAMNFESP